MIKTYNKYVWDHTEIIKDECDLRIFEFISLKKLEVEWLK